MTPLQLDTMRGRIVAGTGHRPDKLGGHTADAMRRLDAFAEGLIDAARPRKVISGMALGWDQALVKAAGSCGIPYIAAVPFKGQESRWPFFSRKLYEILLSGAAEVIYVCEPGYAPWKMQRRNEWMVNNCEVLLELWDGSDGGTANCVRYADRKGVTAINAWPYFAGVLS